MKRLIPLIIFVATIGLIELGCRIMLWSGKEPAHMHPNFSSSLENIGKVRELAISGSGRDKIMAQRLLDYGIEAYEKRRRQVNSPLNHEDARWNAGLHARREIHGRLLPQNLDDIFIKVGVHSQKEKLRMYVRTNKFHRRDSAAEKKNASHNILFYGCSFTFGEGVNEENTVPYLVSQLIDVRGYNFGIMGSGPSDHLRNLELHGNSLLAGIADSPTTVVYTFLDDHMRRVVRSSHYLTMYPVHDHIYFYKLNENGELSGMEGRDASFLDFYWFRSWFGKSAFAKVTGQELPWLNDYHYRMFAKILSKQRDLTKKKVSQLRDFIVAVFPGQSFFVNILRPYLEAEGFKVIDYSYVGPGTLNTYDHFPTDGHPSADLYRLYSWLLAGDLHKMTGVKMINANFLPEKK